MRHAFHYGLVLVLVLITGLLVAALVYRSVDAQWAPAI